ncbi:MAG: hypothetical protein H7Z40_17165 [Phycisphaerae bacterium]|nr:hypothetical protein [Gemmatimonadaceae bacterium]
MHQFKELLYYPLHRDVIAPLIREWFCYEVRPAGTIATIHDAEGQEVTIASVHDAIQADPERQGRLYREAMTLWH